MIFGLWHLGGSTLRPVALERALALDIGAKVTRRQFLTAGALSLLRPEKGLRGSVSLGPTAAARQGLSKERLGLPCEANQRSPKGLPGPSPSTPVIPICVCLVFIFMDTGSGPTSQPGCALDGREIGTYSVPPSWTFFPKKALSLSLS